MIAALGQLEWNALQLEAENSLIALREAREHRRLLLRTGSQKSRPAAEP